MSPARTGRTRSSDRPIRFLDLGASHQEVRTELDAVYHQAVDQNGFIGGASVECFEKRWAAYCTTDHAVGVANGTDALELALLALGIGPGDEVIVPTNTFIATAEAVVAVGAEPHLVDIDRRTLLLDPALVEASIRPATAAIIAVHLYGEMAPMSDLRRIAKTSGLALIEDAAQAHGAAWDGERAGSLGHVGCFSFYPGKNLGALGDGGAVVTNDAQLAATVRSLGNHGRRHGAHHGHPLLGRNSRLDAIQAGFLDVKLDHLDRWNAQRRRVAERYDENLQQLPQVTRPHRVARSNGVHHLYVVGVDGRDQVRDRLASADIATGVHYPVPCHLEPALAAPTRDQEPCPEAELWADRLLSLPMSPHLENDEVDRVCEALAEATAGPVPRRRAPDHLTSRSVR